MSNEPPDLNPYASPAALDSYVQPKVVSTYEMLKDVKRFRSEIHALGGLWILIGCFPVGVGLLIVLDSAMQADFDVDRLLSMGMFVVLGTPFLIVGAFTCLKQMWAVYIGLIMSYVLTGLSLLLFNLCAGIAFLAGIFGGHRVISWSHELRRKGIPLTTKPRDIKTPIQVPTFPSSFPPSTP